MTKQDLKIVFFGTPDFAVTSLDKLIKNGYNVAAVVTMPDKPAGRGRHIIQSDVKRYAVENNIPVLQPEKLKDEDFVNTLANINANLFIVIAFRMLPEVIWNMPPLGTFNLHASLLPKYRGAAPINWAVINGEKETGVTTFFLKHEIDTGDVIQQQSIEIGDTDNVGIVHDKLMNIGADMVVETVNNIINGNITTIPQEQMAKTNAISAAPKIFKETCHIRWNRPAMAVYNLIRGLSPYPAAWSQFSKNGKDFQLKIFETALPSAFNSQIPVGTIFSKGKHVYVNCADGALELLSVQLSGKRRMDIDEFTRGFDIENVALY